MTRCNDGMETARTIGSPLDLAEAVSPEALVAWDQTGAPFSHPDEWLPAGWYPVDPPQPDRAPDPTDNEYLCEKFVHDIRTYRATYSDGVGASSYPIGMTHRMFVQPVDDRETWYDYYPPTDLNGAGRWVRCQGKETRAEYRRQHRFGGRALIADLDMDVARGSRYLGRLTSSRPRD